MESEVWVSLQVNFSEELPPTNAISTPRRGKIQFSLPGNGSRSNLSSSIGGGSRGSINFRPPGNGQNPTSSVSGGSRGSIGFRPPGNGQNPTSSVSGGSRGEVRFQLPGDRPNPLSSIASGSRGDIQFRLPDDRGNPTGSIGGGSRGNVRFQLPGNGQNPISTISGGSREGELILFDLPKLQAILPPTNSGKTVANSPTIYVYLPPLGAEQVFFSVQDEAGNFSYDTVLAASPDGGIMAVTIPDTEVQLELDKPYLWYFAPLEASGQLKPNNYAVTGWIRRVDSDVIVDVNTPPIQRAIAYAEEGIWYDTLAILADAKRAEPDNVEYQTEWQDLLAQIDLEMLSTQPIISQP